MKEITNAGFRNLAVMLLLTGACACAIDAGEDGWPAGSSAISEQATTTIPYKMTFDDSGYVLMPPPYEANDPNWTGAGDPRPYIKLPSSSGTGAQKADFVIEEGTPYTITLRDKRVSTDGGQLSTSIQYTAAPVNFPFFGVTIPPTVVSATHPKDKVQLSLPNATIDAAAASTADHPNRRYIAFKFKLDAGYETPARYSFALHFEAWQNMGYHPPLAMLSVPNELNDRTANIYFQFKVLNDADEAENKEFKAAGLPQTAGTVSPPIEVTRGDWHHIVILMQPQTSSTQQLGAVAVWFDKPTTEPAAATWVYHGLWGYKATNAYPKTTLDLGVGTYRHVQDRTHKIFFDNIRFGKSYTEVTQ